MSARMLSAMLGPCLLVSACGGSEAPGTEQARGAVVSAAAVDPRPTSINSARAASPSSAPRAAAPAASVTPTWQRAAPVRPSPPAPSAVRDAPQQPSVREPAPVAAGTYRYETRGTRRIADGPPRAMPSTTTLAADPPEGRRQRQERDLRDPDGTGTVVEQVLQYDAEGVRLAFLRLSATFAGISNTYAFTPSTPPLVVKAGFPPDAQRFVLEGDGVRLETTVTVGAREPATVGRDRVQAAVVTFDSRLSGRLIGSERAVRRFDTEQGVMIGEEVRSEVASEGIRLRTHYRADLTSLRPS